MSDAPRPGGAATSRGSKATPGSGYALFLAQGTYRQRRMVDAAGLLPVLGALLFAMPLLWMGSGDGVPGYGTAEIDAGTANGSGTEGDAGSGGARTSYVMIYLFVVWGALAVLSALVTRKLTSGPEAAGDDAAGPDGTGPADTPQEAVRQGAPRAGPPMDGAARRG